MPWRRVSVPHVSVARGHDSICPGLELRASSSCHGGGRALQVAVDVICKALLDARERGGGVEIEAVLRALRKESLKIRVRERFVVNRDHVAVDQVRAAGEGSAAGAVLGRRGRVVGGDLQGCGGEVGKAKANWGHELVADAQGTGGGRVGV